MFCTLASPMLAVQRKPPSCGVASGPDHPMHGPSWLAIRPPCTERPGGIYQCCPSKRGTLLGVAWAVWPRHAHPPPALPAGVRPATAAAARGRRAARASSGCAWGRAPPRATPGSGLRRGGGTTSRTSSGCRRTSRSRPGVRQVRWGGLAGGCGWRRLCRGGGWIKKVYGAL